MKELSILESIAKAIDNIGGKVFFVGGYVRDLFTMKPNKDIDVEIYGILPRQLEDILSSFGMVDKVGSSFGVFMIHGLDIDFAMPRREVQAKICPETNEIIVPKYGTYLDVILDEYPGYHFVVSPSFNFGHRDFIVFSDPFMSIEEATKRRDFTCNSLMKSVLTGDIVDVWGGIKDIEDKIIRHINDETFVEDPLRVLRACQFASRFEFQVADETIALCRTMQLSTLPKERIYEEMKKALLKSTKPSIAFEIMREMGVVEKLFPELNALINCKQNPEFHPEGDVWNHTMMVLNKASELKEQSVDAEIFMFGALLHDIGKPLVTVTTDGRITSNGHDDAGIEVSLSFLNRITNEKKLIDGVVDIVKNHMRPFSLYSSNASDKAIRRLSVDTNIENILLFTEADATGREVERAGLSDMTLWFRNKLIETGADKKIEPLVKGRDLIELGYTPGKFFGSIKKMAFELQLEGLSKEEIIKEICK